MVKSYCTVKGCHSPTWMRWSLISCSILGFVFASWAIMWPELWFNWSGMEKERYDEIWMAIGMFKGLLALGLLIVASNPIRHWPCVLIVFLAKIALPVGFLLSVSRGVFPLHAGWVILLTDVIWLPPIFMILWTTAQAHAGRPPLREKPLSLVEALQHYELKEGVTLHAASAEKTLTVVFLRHFGCTFTRQLLKSLDSLKKASTEHNSQLVLVHMLQRGEEKHYLENDPVARISDPYCELYRSFGLGKGGLLELFGPTVIYQGIMSLIKGCGVGHIAGDGLQLPGAFLVKNGAVIKAQRARNAAELPDLEKLFEA